MFRCKCKIKFYDWNSNKAKAVKEEILSLPALPPFPDTKVKTTFGNAKLATPTSDDPDVLVIFPAGDNEEVDASLILEIREPAPEGMPPALRAF